MPRCDTAGPRHPNDGGAVTALLLAGLLFVSALAIATAGLLSRTRRPLLELTDRLAEEEKLEAAAEELLRFVAEDPSPAADSLFDPAWAEAARARTDGVELSLEDVSSRLDLNLTRGELLRSFDFGGALLPGREGEELLRKRLAEGPFASLAELGGWLDPEAAAPLFTVYGYVNPSTSDPSMSARLLHARLGSEAESGAGGGTAADPLAWLRSGVAISSRSDLEARLAPSWAVLATLVSLEPAVNVNLAPLSVLRAIARYVEQGRFGESPGSLEVGGLPVAKAAGRSGADEAAARLMDSIVAAREAGEIDGAELKDFIAEAEGARPPEDHPLTRYLGTRTWFWRITASGNGLRLVEVAARLPGEGPSRFALVERRCFEIARGRR